MAMVVYNNMGALKTLNTMNENSSQLAKDLKKVSTGMRINAAADGASEYAFSMRLRSLEGALGQDIDNAKTGNNLVAVAEGGIQDIIDIMREMKEMALNSANDTNNDLDRATLQKDFSKRMEVIADIAATTNYNGKLLLNGDYSRPGSAVPVPGTPNSTVRKLVSAFTPSTGTSAVIPPGRSNNSRGYFTDAAFVSSSGGRAVVNVDFSGAQIAGTLPDALHDQGFVILCGTCNQYLGFKFDATTTTSTNVSQTGSSGEFVIGVQNVTSMNDLAKAIYDGLASIQPAVADPTYTTAVTLEPSPLHSVWMAEDPNSPGKYVFLKVTGRESYLQFYDRGRIDERMPIEEAPIKPPLIIHTGPKQNQYVPVYINSMHPIAMGLNKASVDPRDNAIAAITYVDWALEYALDEQTYMGSYRQRLSQSEENLVTEQENTTATKSTLQDADMAKEMQNYTKSNVLTQSAQSMLSQANQNSSGVLDLLQ